MSKEECLESINVNCHFILMLERLYEKGLNNFSCINCLYHFSIDTLDSNRSDQNFLGPVLGEKKPNSFEINKKM